MLEDGEIAKRCQSGRMAMMDILIDRYKTDLYSLCMRLTRSGPDADDLFQDTWVRVMERLDSYNPERRFKTWLFTICVNRYRDLYRWRKRWWRRVRQIRTTEYAQDDLAALEGPDPDPEQQVISGENRVAVREMIDGLEDPYRLPILLYYFQGLSVEELAEVLEIPQGTVKTRLHRGREKLRAAMEDAGHGR